MLSLRTLLGALNYPSVPNEHHFRLFCVFLVMHFDIFLCAWLISRFLTPRPARLSYAFFNSIADDSRLFAYMLLFPFLVLGRV